MKLSFLRQLWVQLSLVFSIVVILAAITVSFISDISERNTLINLGYELMFRDENSMITGLQRHIDEGRPLDNTERIINRFNGDLTRLGIQLNYALADTEDNIIVGDLSAVNNRRTYVLERDGETVAILYYNINSDLDNLQQPTNNTVNNTNAPNNNPNAPANPNNANTPNNTGTLPPQARAAQSQDHINVGMILAIGSIAGIGGGILMSRYLTSPLSTLAQTAREFGERNFDQRTPVEGSAEFREVAIAFNQMADAIKKSEYLRNNMIADTAHELRTPLSVMEGNLRAIIDDVYPLSKTEIMRLYEQTRQLSRLVNDLHQLALADAHELNLHLTETDINQLLHDTIDIFSPVAEAEIIHMTAKIKGQLPHLMIDRGRVRQVIHNLLVNALRHTDENGSITIEAYQQAEHVVITIQDTGTGIPEKHLPHIFERFYRADASRDRASGGTGLGLAIGKAIIEAHKGTISVQSQTDAPSGTRFTITLPLNS